MLALFLLFSLAVHAFELISHKGIHHEECLDARVKCRGSCLTWSDHHFIENTIPAIKRAFELGADQVEIDLRFSSDGEIVVYHDFDLGCRTELSGMLRHQPLKVLRGLDLGYNLQYLNREGHPLRGKGRGLLPTLSEVLAANPGRKFFLNPKESHPEFLARLNEVLHEFTAVKKSHRIEDFSMWGPWDVWKSVIDRFPNYGPRFANAYTGNTCEAHYQMYGWSGYFPEICMNLYMVFSEERVSAWSLWGWPTELLDRFHKNGSKVYLIHVKDRDNYIRYKAMGFDGIITSRLQDLVGEAP
jgi:glycerophosphoryl diester phosphodiesterase